MVRFVSVNLPTCGPSGPGNIPSGSNASWTRPAVAGVFLHGDLEARLFRLHGRENRMSGKARHQNENAGTEEGTENLVEFEGVHSWIRLQAGKVD